MRDLIKDLIESLDKHPDDWHFLDSIDSLEHKNKIRISWFKKREEKKPVKGNFFIEMADSSLPMRYVQVGDIDALWNAIKKCKAMDEYFDNQYADLLNND